MATESNDNWRTLKLGDKVRIVRIPSLLFEAHYQNGAWDDTLALYRTLISNNAELTISEIDEIGRPWIEYDSHDKDGNSIANSLAIDDDSWERAD